jgi:hypothetical protein
MVICSKCLIENVPVELAPVYGLFLNAFAGTGWPLTYALGYILPTEESMLADD